MGMAEAATRNGLAAAGPAVHDVELEASEEIASFLELGDPGVDFPLLRSRLNQLRRKGARCGGGGDDGDRPVLFTPETQRQISEYVLAPLFTCKYFFFFLFFPESTHVHICAHLFCLRLFVFSFGSNSSTSRACGETTARAIQGNGGGRGRHLLLPAHHDDERTSSETFTKVSKPTPAV